MTRVQATGPLAHFVESFWMSPGGEARHAWERALPTAAMTLVINLGPEVVRIFRDEDDRTGLSFRHSVVWGPQTRYAVRDSTRRGAVVGVQFRPGMAGAILGIAASELTDQFVSLEDLCGHRALELRERLLQAGTPRDKISAAQQFLAPPNPKPLLPHPAVAFALRELAQAEAPSVGHVQSRCGYGARRFIELFVAAAGMTPKCYSRLQRFQNVLKQASRDGRKPDWARIAADGGYTDQAHLTHEFKGFSGITPGAYRPVEQGRINHVAVDCPAD